MNSREDSGRLTLSHMRHVSEAEPVGDRARWRPSPSGQDSGQLTLSPLQHVPRKARVAAALGQRARAQATDHAYRIGQTRPVFRLQLDRRRQRRRAHAPPATAQSSTRAIAARPGQRADCAVRMRFGRLVRPAGGLVSGRHRSRGAVPVLRDEGEQTRGDCRNCDNVMPTEKGRGIALECVSHLRHEKAARDPSR